MGTLAGQRDRGRARHLARDRPAEGLAQQRRLGGVQRSLAGEAGDRRLAGLGVPPGIADLLAQAVKRSLSAPKLAMPWASLSVRKRSRMKRLSRSCLPRPSGAYGRLWIRRMPSTAQLRSSAASAYGAPFQHL